MNKYNVRCKLILPSHKHSDQIDCQKFFEFFKNPSLLKEFLSQMKRHAGIFNRNSQEIKNIHKNSLKAKGL